MYKKVWAAANNFAAACVFCLLCKNDIQLGTVKTKPEYRARGLCARLMQEVLSAWKNCCEKCKQKLASGICHS